MTDIPSVTDLAWMRPKLAEVCKLKLVKPDPLLEAVYSLPYLDEEISLRSWRPEENIEQAKRCLEMLDLPTQINNTTHDPRQWIVSIWKDQDGCDAVDIRDSSLERAICLAIAAALEWSEHD